MDTNETRTVDLGHGLTLEPTPEAYHPWRLYGPIGTFNCPDVTAQALIAACGAEWLCERDMDRAECERREHADKGLLCGYRRDLVDIPPAAGDVPGVPEPLPEEVERLSDGTTWLRAGCRLPDRWEAKTVGPNPVWVDNGAARRWRDYMVPVRPVPVPAPSTVQVPWGVELIGRRVEGHPEAVNYVAGACTYGHIDHTGAVVWSESVHDDGCGGTVACLPLGEDGAAPSGDGTVTQ